MSGKVGSITTGIITDGLVFNIDAANRASTIPNSATTKTFNTVDKTISGSFINNASYQGPITSSLLFDGSDDQIFLGPPETFILEKNKPFSTNIWFKSHSTGGILLSKELQSGNYTGYVLNIDTNKLSFFAYANGLSDGFNVISSTTLNVDNTTWYNYGLTYDGNNTLTSYNIYLNGNFNKNGGFVFSGDITSSAQPMLGNRDQASSTGNNFGGEIACVQIYNRALSSTEVLHNYNALKGRFS